MNDNHNEATDGEAKAKPEVIKLGLDLHARQLWWYTRLHLVAALSSDFTEIRQFVLLDAERSFLTMSSPLEIRRALLRLYKVGNGVPQ
jgi:hypothetical protein